MSSIFNITNENNSFSISTLSYWTPEGGEEHINKLNNLLELRFQNDIELHAEEFGKRGTRMERENSGYILAGFDLLKSEIIAELRRVKYKDLEDMVF